MKNNLDIYEDFSKKYSFENSELKFDDKNYFDKLFSCNLNWDIQHFRGKLNLFCPFFLQYISSLESPKIAEFYSGIGMFLKVANELNPSASAFYVTKKSSNSSKVAKLFLDENSKIVKKIDENIKYDIIYNDSIINLLDNHEINDLINVIHSSLNSQGVFFLLVDLDMKNLRKDFDLVTIHNKIAHLNMMCVYGKNTFCSMWIKK